MVILSGGPFNGWELEDLEAELLIVHRDGKEYSYVPGDEDEIWVYVEEQDS